MRLLNTILFFAFILLALILGTRLKINIGLIALAFAYLLGMTAGGLTPNGVVSLFPVSLFFNFMMATFLFGFAQENGTLKKVAEHLLYACRGMTWMLGLLFFLITTIVAGLGAGGAAPFFMSAICFSLAIQAGINPLLVSLALWMASMVGGSMPWTSGYATNVGQLEIYFDLDTSSDYVIKFFVFRAVFYTILYLLMFLVLRGYKVNAGSIFLDRPAPFDENQRRTLAIILGIIAMIVIPAAVELLLPNPVTQCISTYCSFQFLAVVCNAIEEDSGLIPTTLWNTLYPAIQSKPLEGGEDAKHLEEYLSNWSCAPKVAPKPNFLDDYYGVTYILDENLWHLRSLSVQLEGGAPQVALETDQAHYLVQVGLNGEWIVNDSFPPMPKENDRLNMLFGTGPARFLVSGGWASDFCFVFQVRSTDWMDYNTFYCRFNGPRLSLVVESNMEWMSHNRRRIPMKPWKFPDHQIEGRRREGP